MSSVSVTAHSLQDYDNERRDMLRDIVLGKFTKQRASIDPATIHRDMMRDVESGTIRLSHMTRDRMLQVHACFRLQFIESMLTMGELGQLSQNLDAMFDAASSALKSTFHAFMAIMFDSSPVADDGSYQNQHVCSGSSIYRYAPTPLASWQRNVRGVDDNIMRLLAIEGGHEKLAYGQHPKIISQTVASQCYVSWAFSGGEDGEPLPLEAVEKMRLCVDFVTKMMRTQSGHIVDMFADVYFGRTVGSAYTHKLARMGNDLRIIDVVRGVMTSLYRGGTTSAGEVYGGLFRHAELIVFYINCEKIFKPGFDDMVEKIGHDWRVLMLQENMFT